MNRSATGWTDATLAVGWVPVVVAGVDPVLGVPETSVGLAGDDAPPAAVTLVGGDAAPPVVAVDCPEPDEGVAWTDPLDPAGSVDSAVGSAPGTEEAPVGLTGSVVVVAPGVVLASGEPVVAAESPGVAAVGSIDVAVVGDRAS
ncbi:MAG TPA: hypothetical protein VHW26_12345 [Solirubrobacteraceae bacterium]|nr:hypothetical protein [Solirubrobacteraceae bacterium]